jgi:hypothetical protein
MVPLCSDVILEMIGPTDDDRPFYDALEVAHQVFSAMMAENLKCKRLYYFRILLSALYVHSPHP